LTEKGKKDGVFRLAQSYEDALPAKLQRHHEKSKEVNVHHRHTGLDHLGITVENMHKKGRKNRYDPPQNRKHNHTGGRRKLDRFFHPIILTGSVVKTHHRLRAVGQSHSRHVENLPDRTHHRHHAHVQVSAPGLQRGIADDLHHTVGKLHHKTGQTQHRDIFYP